MENENKIFSTRDLYLATSLLTLRFPMVSIDFQVEGDKGRPVGYFNFEDTKEIREADRDFWQGKLALEPKIFITNMRLLKSQINSTYKSPHSSYNNPS